MHVWELIVSASTVLQFVDVYPQLLLVLLLCWPSDQLTLEGGPELAKAALTHLLVMILYLQQRPPFTQIGSRHCSWLLFTYLFFKLFIYVIISNSLAHLEQMPCFRCSEHRWTVFMCTQERQYIYYQTIKLYPTLCLKYYVIHFLVQQGTNTDTNII